MRRGYTFLITEEEEMVAQMLVSLAQDWQMHVDDLVLITEEHVLHLDDYLDHLLFEPLYVILMARIDHRDYAWPWEKHQMILMAIYQRGRTDRPYEVRRLGPCTNQTREERENYFNQLRGGHHMNYAVTKKHVLWAASPHLLSLSCAS